MNPLPPGRSDARVVSANWAPYSQLKGVFSRRRTRIVLFGCAAVFADGALVLGIYDAGPSALAVLAT